MKKIILFILISVYSFNYLNAQTYWIQQNSGVTFNLHSVFFVNALTGFISCDNKKILKTTDGGNTWFICFSGSGYPLRDIYFPSTDTGYAVGPSYGESGTILKTTNCGVNWLHQQGVTPYPPGHALLYSVSFINNTTGFIGGENTAFLLGEIIEKTTNGGLNWNTCTISGSATIKIQFLNATSGYKIDYFGYFYKTTNSGVNWSSFTPSNVNAKNMFFFDLNTGFLTGQKIVKTINGCNNWTIVYEGYWFRAITFANQNTGYAVHNRILKTTNGGNNWEILNYIPQYNLKSIHFENAYTGWAVGDSGLIIKTTTGGTVFVQNINTNVPDKTLLYQNYPNPYNPLTSIKFDIPINGLVNLQVYDVLGRKVATIINEVKSAGSYSVDFNAAELTSGIYFYKFTAGDFTDVKKMLVVK